MDKPVLIWRHGTTRAEAKAIIQRKLEQLGYAKRLSWNGDSFSASVGFGAVLRLTGEVTDTDILVHNIGGAASAPALAKIQEVLNEPFPGGSQIA